MKEAKRFRSARRTHRLRQQGGRVTRVGVAAPEVANCLKADESKRKRRYCYKQQGCYGDVELRKVRLDSCAQFSVAGVGLRKYGRCLTRDAPVDIVEGFEGGTSRVLGVWRFTGTTQYQQRITIDALLVEGQGDELLIGEDWMVERQVKMDFSSRELKYLDVTGQKVILPFACLGVSTLQQAGQERRAVVPLAKTVKLATYTRSVVQMKVDAEDGTTGVFLPKPTSKRHLLIAPTVDTVKDGKVSVVVLNVEGRREKLPAREALGTWIPTDADMQILSLNGELERDWVVKWVDALKKDDARPLQDEDKLDIGDMEAADKDLVIALLRQYAGIVEKKPGCPPLAKVNVEHHINTGNTAPIMQRRRRHAVSENLLIDKEVDDMLSNQVIEPGEGAWGFPVVIVRKKDGSEYDFDIQYRPGKVNHVADALSRGPVPVTGERADDGDRPADDPVIGLQDVQSVTEEKVAAVNMQYAAEPMHGSKPEAQSDEIDADVDGAARSVIQAAAVRRVEAAELGVVQFTDDDIKREQDASVMVQSLPRKGAYRGQWVYRAEDGLVRVELEGGDRTILPVIYWALAFKEAHDSIWAGHLRGPPTLERLQRMYWWPRMREAVQSWVAACQDCGSRKAKPKAVVPPLRSVRTGNVCDRWAIDVAGPLPVTAGGKAMLLRPWSTRRGMQWHPQ
ncbi:hypothetical protein PR001_g1867 [Phytophthora rubi]|uniref:Integrase zinc-binding domain-containing protein n=2 Tax=Phytophthora rubi TaxID=129364 RepID=A0A6A3NZI6_9STRA|nr:hypothetical protein PR001_g1867 [Phytophthora rubi]